MTCNIKCVDIEVTICGDVKKCIPISPIRIITMVLATISGCTSMIWLLSKNNIAYNITRRLCYFLVTGNILMITSLLVAIDPGTIYSMEVYNLMEYLLISITTIYFVILYRIIYWKCINNARFIPKNTQSKQKSIREEAEESRNNNQQSSSP